MKQLLLATATLVGMSSAALAQPAALTDSQLDNVTAGQSFTTLLLPIALASGGVQALPGTFAGPAGFAANLSVLQIEF